MGSRSPCCYRTRYVQYNNRPHLRIECRRCGLIRGRNCHWRIECRQKSPILIIRSKNLYWNYFTSKKTVFMCSAITPPKVNGFGWNCRELALADFGSESFRCSRNFVSFCPLNNARFHRFAVGQILRHITTTTLMGVAMWTFGTEWWKFYHKRSFKKTQKLLTKFPGLGMSGRHNYTQWL